MIDPFTLALIGGGAGALLKKDDPLKGAALGAGLGYGGGLLAPGLLGGGAAAGGDAVITGAAGTAGLDGVSAASPGLLGQMDKLAKPAGVAMQAYGMFNQPEQPVQASPLMQNPGTGPQGLSQLAGQGQQAQMQQQQADAERKMRREETLRRMRGGY